MGWFVQRAVVVLALGSAVYAEELPRGEQCSATSEESSCEVAAEVPVIDISPLMRSNDHSAAEWDTAAEAVARACEEWGFFQVCCWCAGGVLFGSREVQLPISMGTAEGRRLCLVL